MKSGTLPKGQYHVYYVVNLDGDGYFSNWTTVPNVNPNGLAIDTQLMGGSIAMDAGYPKRSADRKSVEGQGTYTVTQTPKLPDPNGVVTGVFETAPYMWAAVGMGGSANNKKQSTIASGVWNGGGGKALKLDNLDATKPYSIFVTYDVKIQWKLNGVQKDDIKQTFVNINGIN
jgi:hypothetical protein